MKINKQDEYGLRILLRIAKFDREEGLSIPQLSEMEGMSQSYVAKLTRELRLSGFIESNRGQKGGYVLSKNPEDIILKDVIESLGGRLFSRDFCGNHSGVVKLCTNSVDCSVRSLWKILQVSVDRVLENISLADLIGGEKESNHTLQKIIDEVFGAPAS